MIQDVLTVKINKAGDVIVYHADILPEERGRFLDQFPQMPVSWGCTHAICGGFLDWINTTETTQVVRCRKCGMRESFPRTVRTIEDLLSHLTVRFNQL